MKQLTEFNKNDWLKAKEGMEYYKSAADHMSELGAEERANILERASSITLSELNQGCGFDLNQHQFSVVKELIQLLARPDGCEGYYEALEAARTATKYYAS